MTQRVFFIVFLETFAFVFALKFDDISIDHAHHADTIKSH